MYLCFWWEILSLGCGSWVCLCFIYLFMSVLFGFLGLFWSLGCNEFPVCGESRWRNLRMVRRYLFDFRRNTSVLLQWLEICRWRRGRWRPVFLFFLRLFCSLVFGGVAKVLGYLSENKRSKCRLCKVQMLCFNCVFIRNILRILGGTRWVLRLK